MDLTNIKIVPESDIPNKYHANQIDFKPLFKKMASLVEGEVITVPIKSYHEKTKIEKAIKRGYKHNKFEVYSRKIGKSLYACVKIAEDK